MCATALVAAAAVIYALSLRAAVREVVDEVSLAELISGRMPAHVRKLTTRPDAWQPR